MERTRGPWNAAGGVALLLAATLGAGLLGIEITDASVATAAWWPAAGLGVVTLMLLPKAWWPGLTVALMGVYGAANFLQGRDANVAAWLGLIDVVETVAVAWLLHRRTGRRFRSVADFGYFLGVSVVAAAVAGLGVAAVSASQLDGDFLQTLGATTSAHWASVMLLVPLAMAPRHRNRGELRMIVLQAGLLLAATVFAFSTDRFQNLGFLPLPFLIWAGVSFGYRLVAIEQVVIAILVTGMTLLEHGPFAEATASDNQIAQLYLVSLVIAGLPLALAVGEQRLATAAAWGEKRRTEAVIDASPIAILVADESGNLLSMNPAVTRMTGFTAADLLGRPFWERLIPPDRWHNAEEQIAGIAPQSGSGAIVTSSGGERFVTYSNGFLVDPDDDSVSYIITAADVTAERATTHFLEHLLNSATTVAILGTDREGAITLINAGAEQMLRVEGPAAIGRPFLDFLDPDEVAARGTEPAGDLDALNGFEAIVHEVDVDGRPRTRDWTWLPPDGLPLRVSMTTSLVGDTRHRPIGYLFVARDVTETRRNQELLHQALEREQAAVGHLRALDHAKDDFVSTVSHELRTPLTSIIGSIELLSDGMVGELAPDQRHLVEVVERNAERLLALANDLLLLAAFESGTAQAPFVPVDLRRVIEASTNSIRPLLNHRDLEVRAVLADRPVQVLGDAGYLERAVTNLLTNAVKFTEDGGSITAGVEVDAGGTQARIDVADTGIGIPADEVAEVFQRFFRSSNVHANAIQGTGLGLSIVRSIVESHRGSIDVASEPGAGTIFTITLPLAP